VRGADQVKDEIDVTGNSSSSPQHPCEPFRLLQFGTALGPRQAARDEVFPSAHHVLPHLKCVPLLIEKCKGLVPAHRAAEFVGEPHEMR